jgi:hypothetical protein
MFVRKTSQDVAQICLSEKAPQLPERRSHGFGVGLPVWYLNITGLRIISFSQSHILCMANPCNDLPKDLFITFISKIFGVISP